MQINEFENIVSSIAELRKAAPAFEISNWQHRYKLLLWCGIYRGQEMERVETWFFNISPLECYDLVRAIWALIPVEIRMGEAGIRLDLQATVMPV